MRNLTAYVIIVALTLGLGFTGLKAYQYKVQHQAVWSYLYGPSGLKDSKGTPIQRVQLIDAIIEAVVEESQKKTQEK